MDENKSSPRLKKLAIQGSVWTVLGYGGSQVLRLGSNLVLAWLLFPEAFGLMALVNVFMHGLQMLSDVGIRGSIFFHRRGDDPDFLNTAWTVQIVRGFVLWICSCLIAVPVMKLYGEPMLAQLLPVVGLTAIIAGFNSTAILTLNRQLALGRITLLDVVSQAASVAVMIVWTLMWPTVWAFVAGAIAGALVKMVLSHLALPGCRNRCHWELGTIKSLFRFGKWIFLSTFMTFLASRLDRLLLGILVPLEMLGVYSIALSFAVLPRRIGTRVAASVLHPVLAESARRDPSVFASRVRQAREPILSAGLLVSLGVALLAPAFFGYLYDERYADAGWIAQLLSISVWFAFLEASADRALLAIGDSRSSALANACKCTMTIAGCVVGYGLADLPGLILGIAVGNMSGEVAVAWLLARRGVRIALTDLTYTALFGGLFLLGVISPRVIVSIFGGSLSDGPVELVTALMVLTIVALPVGWRVFKSFWSAPPGGVSPPAQDAAVG